MLASVADGRQRVSGWRTCFNESVDGFEEIECPVEVLGISGVEKIACTLF